MSLDRRQFLRRSGLGAASVSAGLLGAAGAADARTARGGHGARDPRDRACRATARSC